MSPKTATGIIKCRSKMSKEIKTDLYSIPSEPFFKKPNHTRHFCLRTVIKYVKPFYYIYLKSQTWSISLHTQQDWDFTYYFLSETFNASPVVYSSLRSPFSHWIVLNFSPLSLIFHNAKIDSFSSSHFYISIPRSWIHWLALKRDGPSRKTPAHSFVPMRWVPSLHSHYRLTVSARQSKENCRKFFLRGLKEQIHKAATQGG